MLTRGQTMYFGNVNAFCYRIGCALTQNTRCYLKVTLWKQKSARNWSLQAAHGGAILALLWIHIV